MVLYAPVRHHPFTHYDDDIYITDNPQVQTGLNADTFRWSLTTLEIGAWHPLTWWWHCLGYQLFQLNPARHHLMSVALQAANVVLLFWVLLRATGYAGRSFMVAALFALHPMNVESVAWVAEQKNLLSMFFFLLALGAYRWYAFRPGVLRYLAVAALHSLSLLAKPQVITFPLLLLLWDYWPLQRMLPLSQVEDGPLPPEQIGSAWPALPPPRSLRYLLLEKLPFLALSAGCTWLTMKAQRMGARVLYSFPVRLENAIVNYVKYLGKAVWPTRLAVFYPHPGNSLPAWQVAGSCLLLLAITAVVLRSHRRRYLIVGWFWFVISLVPMIGLKTIGHMGIQGMADRYAYLPFIGLFIAVVWQLAEWASGSADAVGAGAEKRRMWGKWLPDAGLAVLAVLAVLSWRQIGYWSDEARLWSHAAQVTSNNWLAENNLGSNLASQGRLREALPHFQMAAAMNPTDPIGEISLALFEQNRGNPAPAIEHFQRAIPVARAVPLEPPTIASLYADLGHAYQDVGEFDKARDSYREATRLDPTSFLAWAGLGITAQRTGQLDVAIDAYHHANQLKEADIGYVLLAVALQQRGRQEEARQALERARHLSLDIDKAQKVADSVLGR